VSRLTNIFLRILETRLCGLPGSNKYRKSSSSNSSFLIIPFPDELEFERDMDLIFEDLKHLEMINRDEKIQYINNAWQGLEHHIRSEIKARMLKSYPGFKIEMTMLNPECRVNPLSVFCNEIVDTIFIYIKESEINKAKQRIKK